MPDGDALQTFRVWLDIVDKEPWSVVYERGWVAWKEVIVKSKTDMIVPALGLLRDNWVLSMLGRRRHASGGDSSNIRWKLKVGMLCGLAPFQMWLTQWQPDCPEYVPALAPWQALSGPTNFDLQLNGSARRFLRP